MTNAGPGWAGRQMRGIAGLGRALLFLGMVSVSMACNADAGSGAPALLARAEKGKSHSEERRRPAAADKSPYGQNPAEYVLTFSEEFDRFDRSRWNDHIWYERSNPSINYAVEDGVLKIWPERDATGRFFNRTIDTDGHFYQQYGYFEMEAKLPRGKGTWPAFWLFAHPGKRRPEIDIMEAYAGGVAPWGFTDGDGIARPKSYGITIWHDKDFRAGGEKHDSRGDLSTHFHRYAVKWEPDRQTFYFDGKQVYTLRVYMSDPMYILLDLWFGSASGEPDENTPEGKDNSYQIRYVRAWQFR